MSSSEREGTIIKSETSFSSSSSSSSSDDDEQYVDDEDVDDCDVDDVRDNDDGDGDNNDDVYIRETKRWVKLVPIGLGLCPWAVKSFYYRNINYRTCHGSTPSEVEDFIFDEEIDSLTDATSSSSSNRSSKAKASLISDNDTIENGAEENNDDEGDGERENRRLMTTLVICPNVKAWSDDFEVFDEFVQNLSSRRPPKHSISSEFSTCNNNKTENDTNPSLEGQLPVTFVAFHPLFLRWRALPEGVRNGSIVETNRRFGLQKSQETFSATIIETPKTSKKAMFGLRRVKVRFQNDDKVQYIPNDWVKGLVEDGYVDGDSNNNYDLNSLPGEFSDDDIFSPSRPSEAGQYRQLQVGPPLPDNAMHRSPYPTIHLIRNEDLGKLQARDVSRVKRKNAQRMMELEWV